MLPITIAFWDYDRTMPIADGRVPIKGCAPQCLVLRPQDTFVRAFGGTEFDVCELSLSRYAQAVARGDSQYIAIPVYPSRSFRHSIIYMRADRGIDTPADLKGRRVGLQNFDDTAAVVVRGMLRDEYGLARGDITWVTGAVHAGDPAPILPQSVHPAISIETATSGPLDTMLADGAIDGLVALLPPASFRARNPLVRRLFADWRAEEEAYFARTKLFPIMHVVGVRRTLLEAQPWLTPNLYEAFVRAKALATANLAVLQAPKATLPWVVAELERTRMLMGEDFWPYGVRANRAVLATTLRHLAEEGLLARELKVDDLFVPALLDA